MCWIFDWTEIEVIRFDTSADIVSLCIILTILFFCGSRVDCHTFIHQLALKMYCMRKLEIKFTISYLRKINEVSKNHSLVTSVLKLLATLFGCATRGSILRVLKSTQIIFGTAVSVVQPESPSQLIFSCSFKMIDDKSVDSFPNFLPYELISCQTVYEVVDGNPTRFWYNLPGALNLVAKCGHLLIRWERISNLHTKP